jgi:two-component system, LytTR family, response regulator
MEPFIISSQTGKHEYIISDVLRIESVSNYSRIYFTDDKRPLLVAKVLSYFEDTLPACTFTRVHRSHLVNRIYIKDVVDCKQSGLQIHLVNGEIIGVSRRKKAAFKRSCRNNWEIATQQVPILPPSYF